MISEPLRLRTFSIRVFKLVRVGAEVLQAPEYDDQRETR